jgi:hypothetical protein
VTFGRSTEGPSRGFWTKISLFTPLGWAGKALLARFAIERICPGRLACALGFCARCVHGQLVASALLAPSLRGKASLPLPCFEGAWCGVRTVWLTAGASLGVWCLRLISRTWRAWHRVPGALHDENDVETFPADRVEKDSLIRACTSLVQHNPKTCVFVFRAREQRKLQDPISVKRYCNQT